MQGFPDDDDDVNPFADPSVKQYTGSQAVTSNYQASDIGSARLVKSQSHTVPSKPPPRPKSPIPQYTPTPKPATNDEFERRERELKQKEDELRKREESLRRSQIAATENAVRQKNFPPCPSFLHISSCYYQNFEEDIPTLARKTVKMVYGAWYIIVLTFLLNWVGALFYLIEDFGGSSLQLFILASVFAVIFVPCSYSCWFRAVYDAFRKDSSFNFFLFFFTIFIQFVACVIFAMGWGACGWLKLADIIKNDKFSGYFMIIPAALFTFDAVLVAFLLFMVHKFYRTSSASLADAQKELTTGLMKNKKVQEGVIKTAQSAYES